MKKLIQVILIAMCIIFPSMEARASSLHIEMQQTTVVNLLYIVTRNGEMVPDGTRCYLYDNNEQLIAVLETKDSQITYLNLPFGTYHIDVELDGEIRTISVVADLAYVDTQNTYKTFDIKADTNIKADNIVPSVDVSSQQTKDSNTIVKHIIHSVKTGDTTTIYTFLVLLFLSTAVIISIRRRECNRE